MSGALRVLLFFSVANKRPKNAPIARFSGLGRYQIRSEMAGRHDQRLAGPLGNKAWATKLGRPSWLSLRPVRAWGWRALVLMADKRPKSCGGAFFRVFPGFEWACGQGRFSPAASGPSMRQQLAYGWLAAACRQPVFRSGFDSSQARQTVRWRRFRGLEFAPVFTVKLGQDGTFSSARWRQAGRRQ